MSIKLKYLIILITLLFFTETVKSENKILFKINDQIITSIDLLNEIKYLKATNNEFKNTNEIQSYEIAKNSLIREKIKEIELINLIDKIEVDDEILNKIIQNNFNYLNIKTLSDFNTYFKKNNINPLDVKKKISIELLWNQLIFSKYKDKVKINVEDLRNQILNEKQTELLLSEILFELEKDEKVDEKYNLIKETINQENFKKAVLLYSISNSSKNEGKIGWVRQTTINKKILNEIKKININEYTKPIVVPGGFLILKVEDTREIKANINLEKELKSAIDKAQNQQLSQYSNIYLNKVRKNITIDEL